MAEETKPAGQMKPSPVPKAAAKEPAPIELQDPVYLPGTLPIYPAKMHPNFWEPEGDGSNLPNPPDPPAADPALRVRANVDEEFKPTAGTEK